MPLLTQAELERAGWTVVGRKRQNNVHDRLDCVRREGAFTRHHVFFVAKDAGQILKEIVDDQRR